MQVKVRLVGGGVCSRSFALTKFGTNLSKTHVEPYVDHSLVHAACIDATNMHLLRHIKWET